MRLPQHKHEDKPFLDANLRSLKNVMNATKGAWEKTTRPLSIKIPLLPWIILAGVLLALFAFISTLFSNPSSFWNSDDDDDNDSITNKYYIGDIPRLEFTLQNLISASIGLSQMAAHQIVQIRQSNDQHAQVKGQTKEGKDELYTLADTVSNSIFINGFRTLFPNVTIVSEETSPPPEKIIPPLEFVNFLHGDVVLDKKDIWLVVDPLDATQEFTEQIDKDGTDLLKCVTTLVCVVNKNEPIAGVLYRPFVPGEPLVWGVATEYTRELHPVSAKQPSGDNAHKIAISRSHTGKATDVVRDTISDSRYFYEPLATGGSGYKGWLVLSGQVDAYVHVTEIKIWDLCAVHALLRAAGGDITDKHGNPLTYSAANPKFKNGLVAALSQDKITKIAKKIKEA